MLETVVPGPVDLYGPIHKGLRWALSSLLVRMGALDPESSGGVLAVIDDLDGVLGLCTSHFRHEQEFIHAALERRLPGCTANLAHDHLEHERAIDHLRTLASGLVAAPPPAWPAAFRALYLAFGRFVADNLAHMVEEETLTQPLLEALFDATQLGRIHERLQASVGPEEMLAFLRVMVPANPPAVRLALMQRMRSMMPMPAFSSLVRSFRQTLAARDYAVMAAGLGILD